MGTQPIDKYTVRNDILGQFNPLGVWPLNPATDPPFTANVITGGSNPFGTIGTIGTGVGPYQNCSVTNNSNYFQNDSPTSMWGLGTMSINGWMNADNYGEWDGDSWEPTDGFGIWSGSNLLLGWNVSNIGTQLKGRYGDGTYFDSGFVPFNLNLNVWINYHININILSATYHVHYNAIIAVNGILNKSVSTDAPTKVKGPKPGDNCKVSDMYLYKGDPLTQTEIDALYNDGNGAFWIY